MKIYFALFLLVFGLTHIVGLIYYRNFLKTKAPDYKPTIFRGSTFFKEPDSRYVIFIFLLTAIAFSFMGYDLLANGNYFWEYIWVVTMVSTTLYMTIWPRVRFGVIANLFLIFFLAFNEHFHWLV